MSNIDRLYRQLLINPAIASKILKVIPPAELANLNIATWFKKASLDGIKATELETAAQSIKILVSYGLNINKPTTMIVQPSGNRETVTLGHIIVSIGLSTSKNLDIYGGHQAYRDFIKDMEKLGIDFELPDHDNRTAHDWAASIDEEHGYRASLFKEFMDKRDFNRRLESKLPEKDAVNPVMNLRDNGGKI